MLPDQALPRHAPRRCRQNARFLRARRMACECVRSITADAGSARASAGRSRFTNPAPGWRQPPQSRRDREQGEDDDHRRKREEGTGDRSYQVPAAPRSGSVQMPSGIPTIVARISAQTPSSAVRFARAATRVCARAVRTSATFRDRAALHRPAMTRIAQERPIRPAAARSAPARRVPPGANSVK